MESENKSDNYIGSYFLVKVKMTDNGNTLAYNDYIAVPVAIDWKRECVTFTHSGSSREATAATRPIRPIPYRYCQASTMTYRPKTSFPGEDTATDINGPQSPNHREALAAQAPMPQAKGPNHKHETR